MFKYDKMMENFNVCINFNGNSSIIWWAISLKATNFNLMVALNEKSGDHKHQSDS